MQHLSTLPVQDLRVLLRLDLDLPEKDGKFDTTRLEDGVPTIAYLKKGNAKHVTVIAHRGRPDGQDPTLSLHPIAEVLYAALQKNEAFAQMSVDDVKAWLDVKENLRFDAREEQGNLDFAKELAANQDLFVNDAFATAHRNHTSIVMIPKVLPSAIGIRFAQELEALEKVTKDPERPIVFVLGGAKLETKLPMIERISHHVDQILLGGKLAVEAEESHFSHPKVVVAHMTDDTLDIDDASMVMFTHLISTAKTVIWNGPMGKYEDGKHTSGTRAIADAIQRSEAYSLVGGGDTEAALTLMGIDGNAAFDHLSTGGGAMMQYLAEQSLAGVDALESGVSYATISPANSSVTTPIEKITEPEQHSEASSIPTPDVSMPALSMPDMSKQITPPPLPETPTAPAVPSWMSAPVDLHVSIPQVPQENAPFTAPAATPPAAVSPAMSLSPFAHAVEHDIHSDSPQPQEIQQDAKPADSAHTEPPAATPEHASDAHGTTFGINGFGRIGRTAFRVWWNSHRDRIDLKLINTSGSMPIGDWATLLKFDSNYGIFAEPITVEEHQKNKETSDADPLLGFLTIGNRKIAVTAQKDPAKIPWKQYGVNTVIESTGVFISADKAGLHMQGGAEKVIISAPPKGDDIPTTLIGVKEAEAGQKIISNASCTTNCVAPVVQVISTAFGIAKASMTTIHSYTDDQNLHDNSHRDLRRARAAAMNIVPTSTGAAIATTEVLPELKGLFHGLAIRVPTPVGSLSDMVFITKRKTSVEEVNTVLTAAANDPRYKGILAVTTDPIVSSDIKGRPESSIVDLPLTQVIDGDLVKIIAWYDNEFGYCNRLVEQVGRV